MPRGFSLVLAAVVLVLPSCGRDRGAEHDRLLASGNAYASERKFHEATLQYRRALQADSSSGEAHYRLGLAYMQLGDRANGLRELILASDVLPGRNDVQLAAGRHLLYAGRFDEARRVASRVLERDERNFDARLLLANALAGLNDLGAAAAQVEEAIRAEPARSGAYANMAAVQLALGNDAKAEEAFVEALRLDPKSVEARIGYANMCWTRGRVADAERLLKEALSIAPSNVLANRTLAAFYVAAGRLAEAEQPLKIVAENEKDSVALRLALADYYLGTGRDEEGRRLLEKVGGLPEGEVAAALRLARHDYGQGRKAEAHARVDRVVAAHPKLAQPLLVKAAFLMLDRETARALELARTAAALEPRLARAQFAIGSILQQQRQPREAAEAYREALRLSPGFGPAAVQLARLHLAEGQADHALQYARDAVRSVPQNPESHEMLVRALMLKGDLEGAAAALTPLQVQHGSSARVKSLAGHLALARGDRAAARTAFEQALEASPRDNDALSGLVGLDLQDGRPAAARQRLESRLKATPGDPAALAMAGRLYGQLGLVRESERAWKRLLEVDASNLQAYAALARLYLQQHRETEALAEAEGLARKNPGSVAAHTMAGFLLEALNRPAEARHRYERALALDAKAVVAANNLAWLLAQGGENLDVALQLAQTAKAGQPGSPEIDDTLGWVYYRKGMYDLAVPPLEQAARSSPGRGTYHYHLGLAYAATKQGDRARASLQRAIELGLPPEAGADARRVLAGLR